MECYTKQYCSICKQTIKINALYFLMNLDNIEETLICDECKKLKENKKELVNESL